MINAESQAKKRLLTSLPSHWPLHSLITLSPSHSTLRFNRESKAVTLSVTFEFYMQKKKACGQVPVSSRVSHEDHSKVMCVFICVFILSNHLRHLNCGDYRHYPYYITL